MVGIEEIGCREVGIGAEIHVVHRGMTVEEMPQTPLHILLLGGQDGSAIGGAQGRGDEPQTHVVGMLSKCAICRGADEKSS